MDPEEERERRFRASVQEHYSKIVEVTIPIRRGHLELVRDMCAGLYHIDPRPVLQRMLEATIENIPDDITFTRALDKSLREVYLTDPRDESKPQKEPELEYVDLADY